MKTEIIFRTKERETRYEGHSFVMNFLHFLYGLMNQDYYNYSEGKVQITDINGNSASFPDNGSNPNHIAVKNHMVGIRLGEGSTPVSISDYNLESMYDFSVLDALSDTTVYERTSETNGPYIEFTRVFKNVSDNPVDVKELGLFAKARKTDGGEFTYMFYRTVLDQPYTVQTDQAVTVTVRLFLS